MSRNVGTLQYVEFVKLGILIFSLSIHICHHQGRVESNQDPVRTAGGQMVSSDAAATTLNMTFSEGPVETGKCKNWIPPVVNSYLHL